MAYDYTKLKYEDLKKLVSKADLDKWVQTQQLPRYTPDNMPDNLNMADRRFQPTTSATDLSQYGLGPSQYSLEDESFNMPDPDGSDHTVVLRPNGQGGVTPELQQANHGWVDKHMPEIVGTGLALMGGYAAFGAGAGAGAGMGAAEGGVTQAAIPAAYAGGGTSIAALTPEAVYAGGVGAANTAIAGMGGAAGIGAAGGGLSVAGGGLLGGGTSIAAMTPEAAWTGGLEASNTAISGISPEAIAGAGGGAGGVSGGLLNSGADPYANETAKLNAQNAAQPGTLNPTNLPSVNTTSPDYLDYANKGMKAYNTISGMAGGQQSGGGMANGTTTNQIDPRMAKYIYGDASNTGILDYAKKMYEANPQGMNAQMVAGMNNQWNTISDPRVKQGFDQIQNTGMGLLSMPIAGNPFTNGGKAQTAQAPQFNPSSFQGLLAGGAAQGAGQNPFSLMQSGAAMIPNGVPYMGGNSQNIDKIKRG